MKLRFYLRGLGIGMVVTALIMGITREPVALTDAQIKDRAAKLGMVEEEKQVLADSDKDNKSDETASNKKEPTIIIEEDTVKVSEDSAEQALSALTDGIKEDKSTSSSVKEDKSTSSSVKEDKSTSSSVKNDMPQVGTKEDEAEDGQANKKTSNEAEIIKEEPVKTEQESGQATEDVVITITSGQSSTAVAQALFEAGVIQDPASFDQFLCSNGYDRKITTGKKTIPQGASLVEIAGILTVK